MENSSAYQGYIRFKRLFILLLLILALITALLAICAGSAGITLTDVVLTLLGHGSTEASTVIFNIRMPRVTTAIVAGCGLATVGCAMQSILKNPLADASTLGIAQGAAFGASFSIIVLGAGSQSLTMDGASISNPYMVSVCAFISSMISTLIILGLSHFRRITPEAMVLSGVALSTMFSGATTLLQYFAADVDVAAVVFWTFGDLGRTNWAEVAIMTVATLLTLIFLLLNRWNFNALQNGEETAKSLGVNVDRMRLAGMFVCSLTAALIVSFIGIINFIGLIAPHLVRRFVGNDYRYLLPSSALIGALLLLLSDTVARLIISPVILPIGAITSLLGAPLFLYLLFKGVNRT